MVTRIRPKEWHVVVTQEGYVKTVLTRDHRTDANATADYWRGGGYQATVTNDLDATLTHFYKAIL